jgi:hypothetical protein|mmetsp:Transcript_5011/g.7784  ORF Transcript_5011/g.7784 Transcript_5011/m.7784 type:complete len:471 (-) Transcript_5011:35-1447(-)
MAFLVASALASLPVAYSAVLHSHLTLQNEHIVSLPMWAYKNDCWKKRPISIESNAASFLQYVPGAGIEDFKPFETVLKDGFMEVDCIMDYMVSAGDKFGINKLNYKLEDVSNVSIVHYRDVVKKMDQEKMTQKVCFEFCRTVPNMGFFGLQNNKCYCAPYYLATAGDSSQCDQACEGDSTLMCGGNSKSSVFAMHNCENTQAQLTASDTKATSLAADMKGKVKIAKGLSEDMQKAGAAGEGRFGMQGDAVAGGLMMSAKVSAGKIAAQAEKVDTLASELEEHSKNAKGITDFKDPAEVTEAEEIMASIDKTTAEATEATAILDKMTSLASPDPDKEGSAGEYFPIMHFVDKKYDNVPSTCGGDLVNAPIVNESPDGCASACNANFQTCVGFSYFGDGTEKLCFLFSKLKTAFYYTGCEKAAFLQGHAEKLPEVTCYAKLSRFEGTSLAPDPSGNCKQCLRKATKANRCYK